MKNKDANFHIKMPIFPYTLGERIVFFLLPEAFCGLKYAENAIAAGAAGGAHDVPPDSLVGWGADTPPHTPHHSAPLARRCSRLRRLDRRAPPDTKSWRHHWSPPLFKVKLRQCVLPPEQAGTNNIWFLPSSGRS